MKTLISDDHEFGPAGTAKLGSHKARECRDNLREFVLASRKRSSQTYLREFSLSYFAHLDGSGQTLARQLIKPSATFSLARSFASKVDGALQTARWQ
jgi:hypothetical protein